MDKDLLIIIIVTPILIFLAIFLIIRLLKFRVLFKVISSILATLVITIGAGLVYFSIYYHADSYCNQFLKDDDVVDVYDNDKFYYFDNLSNNDKVLYFYGGAKVEEKAYAPLASSIAHNGIDVYLFKIPFRFQFFGINYMDYASHKFNHTYFMGHSLGGVAGSSYISKHPSMFDGAIFLASYPAYKIDNTIKTMSIYGSNDLVLNKDSYNKNRSNFNSSLVEHVIEGGNHAGFAYYGAQDRDGTPTISRSEQIEITTNFVTNFIV